MHICWLQTIRDTENDLRKEGDGLEENFFFNQEPFTVVHNNGDALNHTALHFKPESSLSADNFAFCPFPVLLQSEYVDA